MGSSPCTIRWLGSKFTNTGVPGRSAARRRKSSIAWNSCPAMASIPSRTPRSLRIGRGLRNGIGEPPPGQRLRYSLRRLARQDVDDGRPDLDRQVGAALDEAHRRAPRRRSLLDHRDMRADRADAEAPALRRFADGRALGRRRRRRHMRLRPGQGLRIQLDRVVAGVRHLVDGVDHGMAGKPDAVKACAHVTVSLTRIDRTARRTAHPRAAAGRSSRLSRTER